MFSKLFAVCLLVDDLEASLNFYRDTLGLEVQNENGKYRDFKVGNLTFAIFEKSEATSMFSEKFMKSGGGAVLGFQVEDVNEAVHSLKSKGVEIIEGPKQTPWGQTVAYFRDPDGNVWEVSQ